MTKTSTPSSSAVSTSDPSLFEKAAVLVVRIAGNHPLPDGNERLAWQALALNGHRLAVGADEAVGLMLEVAAGEQTEEAVAAWLRERAEPAVMTSDDK